MCCYLIYNRVASIAFGVPKLSIYANTPITMFKFYKVNTNASESKELFFSQDYIESFMQKSALVL